MKKQNVNKALQGSVTDTYNLSFCRERQKGHEFQVILSYLERSS